MQNNLILRFEASRAQLVRVGERVRGQAIERELRLLEGLEALLAQLQARVRAEKTRLRSLERIVMPIDGYDALNAKQVLSELLELDDAERQQVLAYERANKNRKTVLRALEAA